MSPSHFYRSKGGFSLIEVALTLFIIAVALLGMLALIPGALQLQAETSAMVEARLLSEKVLAGLRAAPEPAAKLTQVIETSSMGGNRLPEGMRSEIHELRASVKRLAVDGSLPPGLIPVAIEIIDTRNDQPVFTLQALIADQ